MSCYEVFFSGGRGPLSCLALADDVLINRKDKNYWAAKISVSLDSMLEFRR